ncbi:MAG TPA: glutamine--fructose-6-phosphate transaminase (isomerizing) [Patescibacteria group bacterium]|nr:glutamine--fructose-6-phosphate transaminase (isomerizing) [Patescibacteria group bacterium]
MCGIFGYVGYKDNAADSILEGLKLLEYRGYDSWGVAVKSGKEIRVEKYTGKIGNKKLSLPKSTIGIGHTRWATHGGVTIANAHPHLDCTKKIAVLHNGIVENFQEIKEELIKKGHTFLSETDTEVIPHLVEEYSKTTDFHTAARKAFNRLSGLNAIVLVNVASEEIITAKNGSPLVIGIGDKELFVASDVTGIIKHTRKIIFLEDNQMAILSGTVTVLSLPDGDKVTPQIHTINWKFETADKGKFDHFMIKEIFEQPTIIRNIAKNYDSSITSLSKEIANAKGTFFIGAGTAFHACLAGSYFFSKIAKHHINTTVASEFNYLEDFLNKHSLIIALSQSGETIDVIEPLNRARQKKSTIVGVVNALGSTIYRMADYKLLLHAGPEKAVASTKAYTAKLAVLLLLAFAMNGKVAQAKKSILTAADEMERLLHEKQVNAIKKLAEKLHKVEHIYTIGRGMSYATALEAALKIKEVSYIHTEGLAGGELKHGTIALISKGTPCIVFAPLDTTYDAMISNAMEIKARNGYVIGVSPKPSEAFDYWIQTADTGYASTLTQILPMQLLAYFLALKTQTDPDKPRNLAKSVTVK